MKIIKCPQCGKRTTYENNDSRPFCSDRCRLLDFGAWADGEYAVASETVDLSEEDLETIERAKQTGEANQWK